MCIRHCLNQTSLWKFQYKRFPHATDIHFINRTIGLPGILSVFLSYTVCPRKSGYEHMCQYLTTHFMYIDIINIYYSHILYKVVATNPSSIDCIFVKI